jgi:tetratricopeptide (TPR) repeat protein
MEVALRTAQPDGMGNGGAQNGASAAGEATADSPFAVFKIESDVRHAGNAGGRLRKDEAAMAGMIRDGERLLQESRFEDALECFAADTGDRAWFGRAVALHMLGRFDEAEASYERVLERDLNDEALANLIALNIERFDLERVERHSRRLLERSRTATVAWQGLLVVAVERRDFQTAAECFRHIDGVDRSVTPADDGAIQYRLSHTIAERLRGMHGAVTRSS